MTTDPQPQLDPCGCCEPNDPRPAIANPPGLMALAYRVVTQPTSLRRMLNHISAAGPLTRLTTRATEDPTIALMDAWAMVLDVLSFYQERIANEGYLRTATERRSVLELARTIGYELRPGVAALAYLAYTVEEAPGSPTLAVIAKGSQVQSVPGHDQRPQTFETSADLTARVEWNTLRPRQTRPQILAIWNNELHLLAIGTQFQDSAPTIPREQLSQVYSLDTSFDLIDDEIDDSGRIQAIAVQQIYLSGTTTTLKAGDLLLFVGKNSTGNEGKLYRVVQRLEIDLANHRIRIDLEKEFVAEPPKPPIFRPFIFPLVAQLTLRPILFTATTVKKQIKRQQWRDRDLRVFISIQPYWSKRGLVRFINRTPPPPPPAQLPPSQPGVFRFAAKLGIFGHNAPLWRSLPGATGSPNIQALYHDWDGPRPTVPPAPFSIWRNSLKIELENDPPYYTGADLYLERAVPEVVTNSWVVLERPTNNYEAFRVDQVTEASVHGFALSGKATGLTLSRNGTTQIADTDTDKNPSFTVRQTTAFVQSDRLVLADLPIEDPITQGAKELQLDRMVMELQPGQPLMLTGELKDLPGVMRSEVVFLDEAIHSGGFTQLTFKTGLQNAYLRKTVTLSANVVEATHGETVREIIGSGEGTRANQRFKLKRPPLTYTSAATASGALSSLELRVNGIRWDQAPRLYGLTPQDQRYLVQQDDNGTSHVIFGDGERAARLPTGSENVVATYRSGVGSEGMLAAQKLTLLQSRPLGVRGVTNPLPSSGAADPENRDDAKVNAPLTVLTLDRIVSVQDFEDFARAFAGIGKARALCLWDGDRQIVHLTVAGAAAIAQVDEDEITPAIASYVVEPGSVLFQNLEVAIAQACDPAHRFVVRPYTPLFFNVTARVLVNPRYLQSTVFAAVEAALKAAFAFERRGFGQSVVGAEVITTIQQVEGVIAVDLNQLYQYEEGEPPPPPEEERIVDPLVPTGVRSPDDLAQLLLINPVGIRLEEMTP